MSSHNSNNNNVNSNNVNSNKKDNIGGTDLISRGSSNIESLQKLQTLTQKISQSSPKDQKRITNYLHNGPSSTHNSKKRRKAQRSDDANPNSISKLNPHQQRSLLKRTKKPDKKIKAQINRQESKQLEAAIAAADAELVLHTESSGLVEVEHEMERTYKLSQNELKTHLDEQTAKHIYDLHLDTYAPYGCNYDKSGRCALLYGRNGGHIALMDNHTQSLKTELHLNERVRDVTFLHNTTLFAVAQQNHAYIYDDQGVEIHCMKDHNDIFQMQYLPHHWLLATIGRTGYLKYHDTSTGELVSSHGSKLGRCGVMTQNKSNAVIHCGHNNGVVTMWSPASSSYLIKMLCHKGAPIQSIAIDRSGMTMVTGGADSQVKIWDLRMYKETHAYYTRGGCPTSMDISQKGVLGIAHGANTTFWSPEALKRKVKDPYMGHFMGGNGPIETIRFRPFEDVCGIGHAKGFSSIVIPGSGEPNLDSMEYNLNPYQDTKQRREGEVRALLDKLSPDMIALDPDVIGTIEESDHHNVVERTRQLEEEANEKKLRDGELPKPKEKKRMRGRNKIQKKLNRKRKNIIDENKIKLQEQIEMQKAESAVEKQHREAGGEGPVSSAAPKALKRFFK